VRLRVRVTPRAGRDVLAVEEDGSLRVRLAAPPVDGAANEALIALLAARLRLPKRAVSLVQGATTREKVVEIGGLSAEDLYRRLEAGG
jgi:uncharacterized protein (TIGR00251 family)